MHNCTKKLTCEKNRILLLKKNGFPVWDCPTCFRRFTLIENANQHLSEVYSDNYFFNAKGGYADYLDERDILYRYGKRYAKILSRHTSPGRLLDVGCAAGFIMKGFESSGWEVHGIEPNATMTRYGKQKLHLDIQTGSFEDYSSDNQFRLISLIQVIGHLYNIDKSMVNISRLLEPKGMVLVESWNMDSWAARLFGKNWHEYNPPSVVNWFSDKSLKKLFLDYGFELIDSGHPNKQIKLGHALSIIENMTPNFLLKKKIISSLNSLLGKCNIHYPPFDLKWYIFRKQ